MLGSFDRHQVYNTKTQIQSKSVKVSMTFCEISQILHFTLDFGFLYCTPDDDRMIQACSVKIIIKHKLCQTERMVLFV
jgi:hypothetical protein